MPIGNRNFLDFPPEIRVMIYELLYDNGNETRWMPTDGEPGLLLTNTEIRREASAVFYHCKEIFVPMVTPGQKARAIQWVRRLGHHHAMGDYRAGCIWSMAFAFEPYPEPARVASTRFDPTAPFHRASSRQPPQDIRVIRINLINEEMRRIFYWDHDINPLTTFPGDNEGVKRLLMSWPAICGKKPVVGAEGWKQLVLFLCHEDVQYDTAQRLMMATLASTPGEDEDKEHYENIKNLVYRHAPLEDPYAASRFANFNTTMMFRRIQRQPRRLVASERTHQRM